MVGRDRFGQTNDSRFARAIHKAVGQALHTGGHAGHVDDAAPALGDHFGQHGLYSPKLRAYIQVERQVPVFVGGSEGCATVYITSAIKQPINTVHGSHLRLDSGFVHHIQHGGVDVVHTFEAFQQTEIDIGRPDGCTFSHHGQHSGLANALPSGGNQYVFAL